MGFDLDVTISVVTVFSQGILSFFSPCILPIVPLYMSYLSGSAQDGKYNQKVILINTLFFILGVSFAFFLLGMGFSAFGQFFVQHQIIFSRIGGILIIILGFIQLGVFNKPFGGREFKLPIKINVLKMNPVTALIMGFTFSFAWTPCVGPALSTVLIMISSASTASKGIMLMGIYTLGFTLPFLFLGIFTTKCLELLKKHSNIVAYTVKLGAVLMILMGIMMFTGMMNGITGYLSSVGNDIVEQNIIDNNDTSNEDEVSSTDSASNEADNQKVPAIDFELFDQFGNTHTLDNYKGKVIFLNFWATWCPPCVREMPDIQKLYEDYGMNLEDAIILGVASPNDQNIYTQEGSKENVIDFLEQNGYTYPTIMDMNGELGMQYGISAYPTTFMIDKDGNVFGYVPGMLTYDIMKSIIEQTINGVS
ncbi:cytochrome C biogenesis protein [Candidatus Epulonipiscium fishelsonii]|uniref:Cytochrome C biogenesis protein n=1 Tax=Candidatus Epulonipiscium fishelsonii TaxID=77094 RepID=A0ACC8XDR1_9FIRM|nr:cytochrome C biogenesis protein [Epulopiscium sp. SCG-B05WGA-EpuloA1]ONI41035.1 cytochrome C biogenesis protein [Epulopiscium sp. SCG-B11WGA-EpuloA1]